jgi:hypothetical protein
MDGPSFCQSVNHVADDPPVNNPRPGIHLAAKTNTRRRYDYLQLCMFRVRERLESVKQGQMKKHGFDRFPSCADVFPSLYAAMP